MWLHVLCIQFSLVYLRIYHIYETFNRTNRDLALNCDVEGYPPPDVWWTKNGRYLNGIRTYLNNDNRTLVLMDPQLRDNGIYYCHAKNRWSYANRSFTLELLCKFLNVAY